VQAERPVIAVGQNQRMSVRIRWLLTLFVVVAVTVQMGLIVTLWRLHTAHQPTVTDDMPAMDRAVVDTLGAAGPDPAVAVTGIVRAATCKLDALRTGGRYTRAASLYATRGDEDALITRIAQALPAAYHPRREPPPPGAAAPLSADVGHGIHLSVRQLGNGWITATAATGCTTGPAQALNGSPSPGDPGLTAVTEVLTQLGTRPASIHKVVLACPTGQITTVAAVSQPTNTDNVADRLPPRANGRRYTYGPDKVAYRDGTTSLVVAISDDGSAITVRRTTSC
jgi:hypothetical protein